MRRDKICKIILVMAAIGCVALFNGCVEKDKESSIPDGDVYSHNSEKIVFPNNISQFKLHSNETINKTFVGKNITEISAVYLPNEGEYEGIKAVMIRIVKYPYSSITKTSDSGDSKSDVDSTQSDKNIIIKNSKDRLSNYYARIDINPSFLPKVIGSMIERKQVSSFTSTSGVPTIDETVITLSDTKNGTVERIQDLTINYARVTIYTSGKQDNKESRDVLDQVWNSTLELM